MFDIGWTELAIIALIALLVIGPKDLPQAMRTISGWVRRIRGMAREFQSGVEDMVREAELDGVKEEFGTIAGSDLDSMVENTIDPDGSMAGEFDVDPDYGPPEEPSPPPRKRKKSPNPKTGTKRTAKTVAKSKRVASESPARKVTAKKPATKRPRAKRTATKKAPTENLSGSSVRPPTGNPIGSKARS